MVSGQLFRQEALQAQRQKVHGDVLIALPLSFSWITALITILVIAAVLFMIYGGFARTERVKGWLVPTGGLVKLVPVRAGVVENLMFDAGDRVKKGDIVAWVASDPVSRAGDRAVGRALEALAEQRALLDAQITLEETRVAGERSGLQADISSLLREMSALDGQIRLQKSITRSAAASFQDVQELLEKGFISKAESEQRRQAWLSAQRQEEAFAGQRADMNNRIEQVKIKLAGLDPALEKTLADYQSRMADLDQREAELQGRQSYAIEAPVAGTVTSLSLNVGRAVNGTKPVAVILPEGSTLEAQLFVPSRAAGFVEVGQSVRILYEAFPSQRFGSFDGTISTISGTIQSPNDVDVPVKLEEAFYEVRVTLTDDAVNAFGKQYDLQPGMLLDANIVLERQSFFDWLLEPLRAVTSRG